MKRLGIIVNTHRPNSGDVLRRVEAWAKKQGWPLAAVEKIDAVRTPDFPPISPEHFVGKVDLLLALGGDGTILAAARAVAEAGIPILGINLGTLGFLTVAPPEDAESTLDRVASGDYAVEDRFMLQVHEPAGGEVHWSALNDVVIDKGGVARLITVHVHLNGEFVSEIAGDGLIVATPTGSTAYALSVGGPILWPTMQGCLTAPISAHTLAQRPRVFRADDVLHITVQSVAGEAMLTVDGQWTRKLTKGARVEIRRAPFSAKLVNFPGRSFLRVLRSKLHWGLAPGESRP
jgi:NAD+ kinase